MKPMLNTLAAMFVCAGTMAQAQSLSMPAESWSGNGLSLDQGLEIYRSTTPGAWTSIGRYHEASLKRGAGRPIGRLRVRDSNDMMQLCTAFLVAERTILTAAHCVFAKASPVSGEIDFGLLNEIDAPETLPVDVAPLAMDRRLDVALLRLKQAPRSDWGHVELASTEPVEGATLNIIHHPEALSAKLSECFRGPKPEGRPNTLLHRCETRGGSSGAPIFDETFRLIGVHQGGKRDSDPNGYNRGRYLAALHNFLAPHLQTAPYTIAALPEQSAPDGTQPQPTDEALLIRPAQTLSLDNTEYRRVASSLQSELKETGCYSGLIDGLFGPRSVSALAIAQGACPAATALSPVVSTAPVPTDWVQDAADTLAALRSCESAVRTACAPPPAPAKTPQPTTQGTLAAFCEDRANIGSNAWRRRFHAPSETGTLHVIVKSFPAQNHPEAVARMSMFNAEYPEVSMSLRPTISMSGGNRMYAVYLSEGLTSDVTTSELLVFARHCRFSDGRAPIATDAYGYRQNVGPFRADAAVFRRFGLTR